MAGQTSTLQNNFVTLVVAGKLRENPHASTTGNWLMHSATQNGVVTRLFCKQPGLSHVCDNRRLCSFKFEKGCRPDEILRSLNGTSGWSLSRDSAAPHPRSPLGHRVETRRGVFRVSAIQRACSLAPAGRLRLAAPLPANSAVFSLRGAGGACAPGNTAKPARGVSRIRTYVEPRTTLASSTPIVLTL